MTHDHGHFPPPTRRSVSVTFDLGSTPQCPQLSIYSDVPASSAWTSRRGTRAFIPAPSPIATPPSVQDLAWDSFDCLLYIYPATPPHEVHKHCCTTSTTPHSILCPATSGAGTLDSFGASVCHESAALPTPAPPSGARSASGLHPNNAAPSVAALPYAGGGAYSFPCSSPSGSGGSDFPSGGPTLGFAPLCPSDPSSGGDYPPLIVVAHTPVVHLMAILEDPHGLIFALMD